MTWPEALGVAPGASEKGGAVGGYVTTLEHLLALRQADDRRYAEVALEREKALKIKETADLAALELARQIQTYKDEKANELRTQIERERVTYVTRIELSAAMEKIEVMMTPLTSWVASQQGRSSGLSAGWGYLLGAVGLAAGVVGLMAALAG